MRTAIVSAIGVLVCLLFAESHAQSLKESGQWYAALKSSIGEVTIDQITHRGSVGTGTRIGNFIDGEIQDEKIYDYTGGIGFAIGKRVGNWSMSAEYVWRYRTDWDIVTPSPSIFTVTNVFANIETTSVLFNVARRGAITPYWSWELGAGIGFVVNKLETEYIERAAPGISGELVFVDNGRHTDVSYNVFAGVTRELGGPWSLNVRYRYIELGELEAGPFNGRPANFFADHASQELQFSLECNF